MKLHANARTCPHSRRLAVDRVEREGWTLGGRGPNGGRERAHGFEVVASLPSRRRAGSLDRSSAPVSVPLRTSEGVSL
jgi:hypothetical protein